jgi:predicted thioesterase
MINKSFTQTISVTENQTAEYLGSGTLPVFATPAMIAVMENTAMKVLTDLPEESTSVGISININHLKASKVGEIIEFTATLILIEGRKYSFQIIAKNSNGETIGEGTHERVVVDIQKFMSKLD